MARPSLEVADIFRDHGAAWRGANAGHVSLDQLKVMSAVARCRTAALGGHVARCEDCVHEHIAYNSCRNWHCPKCQAGAARAWLTAREAELLPVGYFHLVFTWLRTTKVSGCQNAPVRQARIWREQMRSSDGMMRDLVTTMPGAGWDYSQTRHPYHQIERPKGPHYCVYNRRHMAVCFDDHSTEDGYWLLRQKAALLNTGELPIQFKGPDAERLLDKLFTKDITKVKVGRCGYGLACYEDGGLIVDGIVLRLAEEKFWYAQADGDFYSWARAHASGMDVEISNPDVFVSQVQGPNSLRILEAASEGGMPEPFGYFAIARVKFGGQEVVITRTGYTNELGWEFYTEPHHDPDALWAHIKAAGEPYGLEIFGLDAMNIRRIEAGILNAGADFNQATTPYDVGLGRFVDEDKGDFIGKSALATASREPRSHGIKCLTGEPLISGVVKRDGKAIGIVTAGATSPYLGHGIGIALLDTSGHPPGAVIAVRCKDGSLQQAELVELPFYDKLAEIPRGKLVDIPKRL